MTPREHIKAAWADAQKLTVDCVMVMSHAASAGALVDFASAIVSTDEGDALRAAILVADDRAVDAPNTDARIYWREVANLLRGVAHSERKPGRRAG